MMPVVQVHGTSLFYEALGSGPAVLMIHGGPGYDHTYFRPDFDRLASRHELIYYDQRLSGRSGRPPIETFTIEQAAHDAAGLLDQLRIRHAIVIGHSYGGFVAQELALSHPERVSGLVLLDTTPGQLGRADAGDADQGAPPPQEFLDLLASVPESDAEYATIAEQTRPFFFHRVTGDQVEPIFADTIYSADALIRSMDVLGTWSAVDRLRGVRAPTLLVVGRHDVACSVSQSERIARLIPTAVLEIVEDAGHFPWVEEPDHFFGILDAWIDRL
jgi:proline iminopeptidase